MGLRITEAHSSVRCRRSAQSDKRESVAGNKTASQERWLRNPGFHWYEGLFTNQGFAAADIPILAGGIAMGLTGAAYGIVRAIGWAIDKSV